MTSNSTAELDRLLSQALADISAAKDSSAVEQLRVGLLGRQGGVLDGGGARWQIINHRTICFYTTQDERTNHLT